MSFDIKCPYCDTIFELDDEDLPDNSCDDGIAECQECGSDFTFGWVAEIEVRQRVNKEDKITLTNHRYQPD